VPPGREEPANRADTSGGDARLRRSGRVVGEGAARRGRGRPPPVAARGCGAGRPPRAEEATAPPPAGRAAVRARIHPGTNITTAIAVGLNPWRSAGAQVGGAGRMLQMVKTLAQFTIALEDMRDLGPAAASGEPAGGSDGAEEPGEAQVREGEGWPRTGPWPRTQWSREIPERRGQMLAHRAWKSDEGGTGPPGHRTWGWMTSLRRVREVEGEGPWQIHSSVVGRALRVKPWCHL
jgi:hypothetical protein